MGWILVKGERKSALFHSFFLRFKILISVIYYPSAVLIFFLHNWWHWPLTDTRRLIWKILHSLSFNNAQMFKNIWKNQWIYAYDIKSMNELTVVTVNRWAIDSLLMETNNMKINKLEIKRFSKTCLCRKRTNWKIRLLKMFTWYNDISIEFGPVVNWLWVCLWVTFQNNIVTFHGSNKLIWNPYHRRNYYRQNIVVWRYSRLS